MIASLFDSLEDQFDCIPDYYTPVLIAGEATLSNRPELTRDFLRAVSRGYTFAAEHPDEAAEMLLASAPELDREVVLASQQWISPRYQAEALRWGEQSAARWQDYADWMTGRGLLSETFQAERAFSNEYLP